MVQVAAVKLHQIYKNMEKVRSETYVHPQEDEACWMTGEKQKEQNKMKPVTKCVKDESCLYKLKYYVAKVRLYLFFFAFVRYNRRFTISMEKMQVQLHCYASNCKISQCQHIVHLQKTEQQTH